MIRYALTIFLSAFLLFQVQPMVGKYILPWFGGTPSVWTTCMLMFQILLLVGYAYAHGVAAWLRPRQQAIVHLVVLAISLACLPITPSASWKPTGDEAPTWRILALLAATIGLPYLALSSTTPLVQSWFSRALPNRSPYRLYALSNAGSLLALLSYPFVVEPAWSLAEQTWAWSLAYVGFVALCGWCASSLMGAKTQAAEVAALAATAATDDERAPDEPSMVIWLVLSACGSTLLLATTNQMCQEVAVVPFLWILPLAVYLVSFILCFESQRWYRREVFGLLLAASVVGAVYALDQGPLLAMEWQVAIYSAVLFVGCMVCHGELANSKPAPRYQTLFYLLVAAGGALGGIFVALVAPVIFTAYWEYQLSLIMCCTMVILMIMLERARAIRATPLKVKKLNAGWRLLGICYCFVIVSLVRQAVNLERDTVVRSRNFYGVLRIKVIPNEVSPRLVLSHGRIEHGFQFTDKDKHRWPTSYYGPDSGIGMALTHHPKRSAAKVEDQALQIGMVGLGTGTIACYAREHDLLRFYEINPQVVRMANAFFTFLKDAPTPPEIVIGDGRIQLERELPVDPSEAFDVLGVDAFSSDAIPLHLLTREAFRIYWKCLRPDGILVINISNRHVDLKPVVRGLADEIAKTTLHISSYGEDENGTSGADWLIVTSNKAFLDDPAIKEMVEPWPEDARPPFVWTDDHASLWQVLSK
jgi:spermidine synthase